MNSTQGLLNWEKIYAWAEEQPAGEIGQSCNNISCPVARYLVAQTHRQWSVGTSIRTLNRSYYLKKPDWIWKLIELVDELTDDMSRPVSREQFLKVLEQVKEGSEE
jgi:hypothetical protein